MTRVLVAGESWSTTSVHTKGFDSFVTSVYEEGADDFIDALRSGNNEVVFQPNHVAARDFPSTVDQLSEFDVVVLSDIGANTLLLPQAVFQRGSRVPDRLRVLDEWVLNGGALLMVGGYLSFQGIEAKANYRNTILAETLPVEMEIGDDREETPDGVRPVAVSEHPVLAGLPSQWPDLLGYQRLTAKPDAEVIVAVGGHPLLALGTRGAGRVAAFASDLGPHWMPVEALAWSGYAPLWNNLVAWLSGADNSLSASTQVNGDHHG